MKTGHANLIRNGGTVYYFVIKKPFHFEIGRLMHNARIYRNWNPGDARMTQPRAERCTVKDMSNFHLHQLLCDSRHSR